MSLAWQWEVGSGKKGASLRRFLDGLSRRDDSRDGFMRAIAKRRVGRLLALTEPPRAGVFGGEFLWGEFASLVGPVTEWLGGGLPAGAIPVIFPGFQFHFDRLLCGNVCAHDVGIITPILEIERKNCSAKQFPQLPHPAGKKIQRGLHRRRTAHINARRRQRLDRIPAAPAFEEVEIRRGIPGLQDP